MCTPIGHSMFGFITYYFWEKVNIKNIDPKKLFIFVILANLPDVDFIPGLILGDPNRFHHVISHSVIFLVVVAFLLGKFDFVCEKKGYFKKVSILSFLLLGHMLIDFFTVDTREPLGIDLFWPYPRYFISPFPVFPSFNRRFSHLVSVDNLQTLFIELLVFLSLFGFLFFVRYFFDKVSTQYSKKQVK